MILDKIIRHKRAMLSSESLDFNIDLLNNQAMLPAADFKAALKRGNLSIIAEIKSKSPSAGQIKVNCNPATISREYSCNSAAAISVLTDEKFFGGDNRFIKAAKDASGLPVLRKDFIISEYQIYESKFIGADAVLLIVRILSDDELRSFIRLADDLNLHSLVEVHSSRELERALACGAEIIGVNNRDLDTLKINIETSIELAAEIPLPMIRVSESGIKTRSDMIRLEVAGYDAVLIGEALMQAPNPGLKLRQLLGTA